MLKIIEDNPAGIATHTVICLHGLGASGNDLVPLARELSLPNVRFVFPEAPSIPVTLNQGYSMPAWYDIRSLDFSSDLRSDHDGVNNACESIKGLIANEQASYGIKPENIFLMGFSQGGSIALELGLHYDKKLAGIIGLSTLPAKGTKTFDSLSIENKSTPLFLAHGQQDMVVPFQVGELVQNKLSQLGYDAIWKSYSMGHEILPQELSDLKQWFSGL